MLCGTSERLPVSASIHLNVKVRKNQLAANHGHMKELVHELGPSLGEREVCQVSCQRLMRW